MLIKLAGNEGQLANTAGGNTFFNATCIKLVVTANAVVTVYNSADTQLGNTTLLATNTYYLQKAATDKIEVDTSTSILATPVAFTSG